MSEMSKIQGTPWHVGRYTRKEGDERRHKSNCAYYRKDDKHCTKYYGECLGSAHCDYYESKNDAAEESILEAVAKVRNKEVVRRYNEVEYIKFIEGMKVYRKTDSAFGKVVKVYTNSNGKRYVIINFNGKNVEFGYEAAAKSGKIVAVHKGK